MGEPVNLRELAIDRGGEKPRPLRGGRHVATRYVLPAALLLGFLALVAWASRDAIIRPQPVTVIPVISSTAEVRTEGTPLFKAAGWIEPRPTPVRVAALASGVVEELLVVEDQPVRAGDPIAELVKDDAKLVRQRAQADLELRQAELDEAEAALQAAITRLEQPVHLEAALEEGKAALATIETRLSALPFEIRRAAADWEALQTDYERKQSVPGVVAGVEIDFAKAKAESAEAMVEELHDRNDSLERERAALSARRDALRTQLKLLADERQATEESRARLLAAKARLTQAQVALDEATLQLERMTVRSPIDGRVYRLVADPGARLMQGMGASQDRDGSTVVTLYRPERLQVRVDVRFEDIPRVSLNQPVEIDNPAVATPRTGRVLFISSEADIQKNTLQVKVDIPDPPAVFKPEMLVDVTFLAPPRIEGAEQTSRELRLFVPHQLVHDDEQGAYVWVADQSDGVARRAAVELGAATQGGLVEVVRGLTVASHVISGGADRLQDGDRIFVTGEDAALGVGGVGRSADNATSLNRLPAGE